MSETFSHKTALKALETYGANFEAWPDRKLALFVQNDASFAPHIKRAAMLDAELARGSAPAPSELLKSRILKAAAGSAQTDQDAGTIAAVNDNPIMDTIAQAENVSRPARFGGFARLAALFLVSAVLGSSLWAAYSAPSSTEPDPQLMASLDAETDAWLGAANDLDMVDIFLWVETDESPS